MSQAPGAFGDPQYSPRAVEPKPTANVPDPERVKYMHVYGFIFENPNWTSNVMYGFLCFLSSQLIPVVGPLLFLGYQFEIIESLHRYPGRTYPDFEFNKFGYYLQRSLWPFLAQLICLIPLLFVVLAIGGGGALILVGIVGAVDERNLPVVLIVGISVISVIGLGVLMVLSLFLQPIILRAGLSQDFGQAFKLGWALDFLKTWLEIVLFQLFLTVTAIPLVLLGYACCIIGMFVSMTIISLAQANMLCQLYNLFLARGGEPIPLKPVSVEPAMAV